MPEADEEDWTHPGELDSDKAGRKVWIVRVPPYVSKQWREALAASAEGLVDEDSAEAATLGHLTLAEGNPTTLRVKGPDGEEQLLYMNAGRDKAETVVMSYEAAADGTMKGPRIDGIVHKRFEAAPVKLADARGQSAEQRQQAAAGQVDESYLAKTRARLAAAGKPAQKRKVAVLNDDLEINRLAGGSNELPLYVKNRNQHKKAQAEAPSAKRSDKMSKEDLEAAITSLFIQQQHWHFTQIQKTLNQPVAGVKEALFQLATQIKRGPNKDLWELKPAVRAAAIMQQKQEAAAAAAAAAAKAAGEGGG